jgi:hypothetical protein
MMQGVFYDYLKLQRLLWPDNSPDLNLIELYWMYLKKETSKDGLPRTQEEATFRWLRARNNLPQAMIQQLIERIFQANEEVICLNGGNEYVESS